jgi:Ca2+-binding RTX toxin-like protein
MADIDEFTRGTNGNDIITDTGGDNDYIKGENGNDRINGGGGNDVLDGGSQDDNLAGGVGNDILIGGSGNDILTGDAGIDLLQGGFGADEFRLTTFNFNAATDYFLDFRLSQGDDLILLSGTHITDAERGSDTFQIDPADVEQFGLNQNDLGADDLILTISNSADTATQTVVIFDAFQFHTEQQWDAYLTTRGFSDFL